MGDAVMRDQKIAVALVLDLGLPADAVPDERDGDDSSSSRKPPESPIATQLRMRQVRKGVPWTGLKVPPYSFSLRNRCVAPHRRKDLS